MTDSISTGSWKPGDRVVVNMYDAIGSEIKGTVQARHVVLSSIQPVCYTVALDKNQFPGKPGGPLPKTAPRGAKSRLFGSGRLQNGVSGDTAIVDVPRELIKSDGPQRLGGVDKYR